MNSSNWLNLNLHEHFKNRSFILPYKHLEKNPDLVVINMASEFPQLPAVSSTPSEAKPTIYTWKPMKHAEIPKTLCVLVEYGNGLNFYTLDPPIAAQEYLEGKVSFPPIAGSTIDDLGKDPFDSFPVYFLVWNSFVLAEGLTATIKNLPSNPPSGTYNHLTPLVSSPPALTSFTEAHGDSFFTMSIRRVLVERVLYHIKAMKRVSGHPRMVEYLPILSNLQSQLFQNENAQLLALQSRQRNWQSQEEMMQQVMHTHAQLEEITAQAQLKEIFDRDQTEEMKQFQAEKKACNDRQTEQLKKAKLALEDVTTKLRTICTGVQDIQTQTANVALLLVNAKEELSSHTKDIQAFSQTREIVQQGLLFTSIQQFVALFVLYLIVGKKYYTKYQRQFMVRS